jgi:CO/xanthine dehydrogenase Mo-binding subunit
VVETVAGKHFALKQNKPAHKYENWQRKEPKCKVIPPNTAAGVPPLSPVTAVGSTDTHDKQADLIVRGKLDYGTERLRQGEKLYARLLCADRAVGKVTGIKFKNPTTTLSALGVKAMVTCPSGFTGPEDDIPLPLDLIGLKKDPPYPAVPTETNVLWSNVIVFCGQEVAAVVCDDPNAAARAINELEIEYDSDPLFNKDPVLDPEKVVAPIKVFPHKPLHPPRNYVATVSDPSEQGWTQFFQHGSLEPVSCIASWYPDDAGKDRLDIWSGSQAVSVIPKAIHAALALLGIEKEQIHVYSHGTGGGHGDKSFGDWCCPTAILSYLVKQPVELFLTRRENFLVRAHQFQAKAEIAIDVDHGTNKLSSINAVFRGSGGRNPIIEGYYGQAGPGAAYLFKTIQGIPTYALPWALQSTYKCDSANFSLFCHVTNKPKSGFWRCVGDSPGTFLADVAMEKKAYELGIDPYQFKLDNLVTPDMVHQDKKIPLSSNGIRECFTACADAINYAAKCHPPGQHQLNGNLYHGIGICGHVDKHGSLKALKRATRGVPAAKVEIAASGKARLYSGIDRASCGTNTAIAHMVADSLGMEYEDVDIAHWGDLDNAYDGGGQGGSTRTTTLGAAFVDAAEKVLGKLKSEVKNYFGLANGNSILVKDSIITYDGAGQSITVKDFMKILGHPIIEDGLYWDQILHRKHYNWDPSVQDWSCLTLATSCSAAEISVDLATGRIEILNFVNVVDNGRAIFHYGSKKQIEGGIEIQIGQGLFYDQIIDPKYGATLNANYIDSKWPTTLDLDIANNRNKFIPIIVESNDACGPFGCKGMGEPCVSNYGCIADALHNATGVWITEPPFTPKKIIDAHKAAGMI